MRIGWSERDNGNSLVASSVVEKARQRCGWWIDGWKLFHVAQHPSLEMAARVCQDDSVENGADSFSKRTLVNLVPTLLLASGNLAPGYRSNCLQIRFIMLLRNMLFNLEDCCRVTTAQDLDSDSISDCLSLLKNCFIPRLHTDTAYVHMLTTTQLWNNIII